MSTYPSRVAAWQEECELHGTAQVCHICPLLPLSAELEVTENFGDFWVSLFHIRSLLRCLVRVFHRDGCCAIYDGDARRHLVRDAESLDRVPQQCCKLSGHIVS